MEGQSTRWKPRRLAFVSALALALVAFPNLALGAAAPPPGGHSQEDFAADDFFDHHHAQHGPSTGHLPGSVSNVELVGKLRLTNQRGDISDVSSMATTSDGTWYAYLGNWGGFDRETRRLRATPGASTLSTSAIRRTP